MRSAICLYGLVGGTEGKNGLGTDIPFEKCYDTYKKHIIDINDADIFIHSWSINVRNELTSLYKPKKCKFEEQIQFKYKNPKQQEQGFRSLSKWYSLREAIRLKKEYVQ